MRQLGWNLDWACTATVHALADLDPSQVAASKNHLLYTCLPVLGSFCYSHTTLETFLCIALKAVLQSVIYHAKFNKTTKNVCS